MDNIIDEPPVAGTEIDTLIGSLERQRRTFSWKADGLDAAALRVTVGVSAMTLGGLLNHLALIEADYFGRKLLGEDPGPPWNAVDWAGDPDWEWRTAAEEEPAVLYRRWADAVARSRAYLARALDSGDAGQLLKVGWPDGTPSLRRMLVDLIEEYARHTGHADLIRESIDGRTGEDPPPGFTA